MHQAKYMFRHQEQVRPIYYKVCNRLKLGSWSAANDTGGTILAFNITYGL